MAGLLVRRGNSGFPIDKTFDLMFRFKHKNTYSRGLDRSGTIERRQVNNLCSVVRFPSKSLPPPKKKTANENAVYPSFNI